MTLRENECNHSTNHPCFLLQGFSEGNQGITLRENRFGIEPEVAIKVGKKKCRAREVGIPYHGHSYGEGKKITWKDGVRAAHVILKYARVG